MSIPFVSVVIVNYNGKHYLPACLDGLRCQTYPADAFEVIVSDNGSKDGSVELLRSQYPWVRVLENGRNLGFAAGNNVAFQAAKGQYLAALNNDTIPAPDWLDQLVRFGEQHPRAGIINGHSRLFYDQLILELQSEPFQPENDSRQLGVQLQAVDSGAPRGVVQYLEGFYGWEGPAPSRYRWTGAHARIGVPVPPGVEGWILDLTLCAPRPADQPVRVGLLLGEESLAEWTLAGPSPQTFQITLPARARSLAEPLVQNAGSTINHDGYGQDRGTFAVNSEMFFEVDQNQYADGMITAACGANILLRIAMLAEIGAFDSRFFMYYEDADLSWRAWLAGWEVVYAHEAVIRHIHCGTTQEWSPFFIFYTERNRLAMLLKNGTARQVLHNWARYGLGVARRTLGLIKALIIPIPNRRALLGRLMTQYRVILSLIAWLPVLLWQRAGIQRKRHVLPAQISQGLSR